MIYLRSPGPIPPQRSRSGVAISTPPSNKRVATTCHGGVIITTTVTGSSSSSSGSTATLMFRMQQIPTEIRDIRTSGATVSVCGGAFVGIKFRRSRGRGSGERESTINGRRGRGGVIIRVYVHHLITSAASVQEDGK